jgi:hypothetical protein
MSDKKDIFSDFTNLYPLSKTLRFELKPVWKTNELLEWENPFPKDKKINEIYQNIIKPCLNDLHSQLIEESLEWASLELDESVYDLRKWSIERHKSESEKKKSKDDFDKAKKELRKQIVNYLKHSRIAKKYPKISWYEILWQKEIIPILAEIYGDRIYTRDTTDKSKKYKNPDLIWKPYKELINDYFVWFFTYLSNFKDNRDNLYKDDGKASRVATRVIDENMIRFFQNKKSYEKFVGFIDLNSDEQNCFDALCFQNHLNQKWIEIYNNIIWGINTKINAYNQNNKWWEKLPKLIKLHKQILAKPDKESIFSFVNAIIEDDEDLEKNLKTFLEDAKQRIEQSINSVLNALLEEKFDYEKTYFKSSVLKDISNKYLNSWDVLWSLLPEDENAEISGKKSDDVISLQEIKDALNSTETEWFLKKHWFDCLKEYNTSIAWDNAFIQLLKTIVLDANIQKENLESYTNILEKNLFSGNFSTNLRNSEKDIKIWDIKMTAKTLIKETIQIVLQFEQILRYFSLEKWQWKDKELIDVEFDSDFYNEIDKFYSDDFKPYKFFNAVRNYVTKKQYSTDKIKLNFDNSTFLDGRDKNKESDNFWVILRRKGEYFLAIMKKGENKIFKDSNHELYSDQWEKYEKLEYKLLPWPNKMLPKVFFSNKNIDFFNPSDKVLNIRKKESFKQWKDFSLQDLHTRIDFMKSSLSIHPDRSKFWFYFKDTSEYKQINEFYSDVENQWYKVSFVPVSWNTLHKYVEEWNLYLFQIYNKDFSEHRKWKENLHTKYWKALFEKENFNNWVFFKLNWRAEIFFRPATVTEKKEKKLIKKNAGAIENKRFTENKILFHCPITLNFTSQNDFKVNDKVKEHARKHKMNVIGIDRWEKHLLYYALIDQNWNILKQGDEKQLCSMNILTSKLPDWSKKEVDYYDKLVKKEWDRAKERVDWNEIENIKEMKQWYLSHVVNKIVDLAIQNNAIIVLEDLNSGFKNGRKKVERQIYQNFELALAKKLNFVVDKNKADSELWWLYNAYQLTPKVDNFQDIYAQTWILFYTQAWYTSITCPICWFRKNIYKKYDSVSAVKQRIKDIELKIEKKWSDFSFFYKLENLEDKKGNKREKLDRKITTKNQIRLFNERIEKWTAFKSTEIVLSEKFSDLFKEYWIDEHNIVKSMLEKSDVKLFKDFMFCRNLLLQIRNSKEWDDWGYLQCPACEFHSDNGFQGTHFNWDANGAYNIARKGVMILNKINDNEKTLWITNVEWDNFTQKEF